MKKGSDRMTKKSNYGMTPEKASEVFQGRNESKLKKIRVQKGLSQAGLAEASGEKKRVVQTYEQGERNINNGQLETLCNLCIALDCKISDILEDEELIKKFKSCK